MVLLFLALGWGVALCLTNWMDWFSKKKIDKAILPTLLITLVSYCLIGYFADPDTIVIPLIIGSIAFILVTIIIFIIKEKLGK